MNYEKTELNFLEKDVIRAFGEEEGRKIFSRASKLYAELCVTTDYQKSPTFERQLRTLVFPVIAYYKTLLAFGYKTAPALGLVRNETEKAAEACAEVVYVSPVYETSECVTATFRSKLETAELIARLKKDARVAGASPNYIMKLSRPAAVKN